VSQLPGQCKFYAEKFSTVPEPATGSTVQDWERFMRDVLNAYVESNAIPAIMKADQWKRAADPIRQVKSGTANRLVRRACDEMATGQG